MSRARLLAALLLLVALAVPAGAQTPCAGPSIAFTQAPVLVEAGTAVRLKGFVVDQSCVPAQRVPVGLTMQRPSAPGTNWARTARTTKQGHFTFTLQVPEPGVVLTVAVPWLSTVTGGISGPLTASVGPLWFTERLTLAHRRRSVQAGTNLRLELGTTEAVCAQSGATYTVQTRPLGGTWQSPQAVACAKKHTIVTTVVAATPTAYPVWPYNGKAFEIRAVREANGPYQVPSVSASIKLRVCKVLLPGC